MKKSETTPSDGSNLSIIDSNGKTSKKKDLENQIVELSALAASQKLVIDGLKKSLTQKNEQIGHLESLLGTKTVLISQKPDAIPNFDEVTIARIQLKRLGEAAVQRDLTNDEARRFEIFSKVIQQDERMNKMPVKFPVFRDITPAKLLDIAKSKIDDKKTE